MKKTIKSCDENGKSCLTAVVATENGRELVQVINEGLDCDVLTWKMEEEEPTAAAVISAALNKCSGFAMRTTEWLTLYTMRRGSSKRPERSASGWLSQAYSRECICNWIPLHMIQTWINCLTSSSALELARTHMLMICWTFKSYSSTASKDNCGSQRSES